MEAVMMVLFVVNPLDKIFYDTPPPREPARVIRVFCARNEYEPAQFAIRAQARLAGVSVEVSPLKHEGGKYVLPAECVRWNFVGFIPITKNTPCAREGVLVRKAPCGIPDVLLEQRTMDIAAGNTQPVWLTFFVPKDAPPGLYRGSVTVKASDKRETLPIELTVWSFSVPKERHFFMTNWFNTGKIAKAHGVEQWSEEFWRVLEKYFRNMAEHRQNVAWVPWNLIKIYREADGRLTFDFSRFDRYVELMEKCGVADRIEIQHIAGGGWGKPVVFRKVSATDRKTGKSIVLDSEEGMQRLLSALEEHLAERGWLERAMLHIADEPSQYNLDTWLAISRKAHSAAPRLRRIDAIEASDFGADLEVWVPKLTHLKTWFRYYEQARARGAELWYYICCHPVDGYYPNRFLDYPLSMVRLLHWLNYKYDLKGYLHWGLNFWGDDPFGPPRETLPPGDTNVLYPGKEGPLNSIRWETQRDSAEDFEYLCLLTERMKRVKSALGKAAEHLDASQRSKEFCLRLVRDFADVTTDAETIQAARLELAREIIQAEQEPLLILCTRPLENTELVPGPMTVEIYGATRPGTKVEGNCRIFMSEDGSFRGIAGVSPKRAEIRLTFSREGRKKEVIRRFRVRGATGD